MARRSLAIIELCGFESPLGTRLEATHDGGRSHPEERPGMGAEVHGIDRREKNLVRRVFGLIISELNIYWGVATR
jgi:hypothetical protein